MYYWKSSSSYASLSLSDIVVLSYLSGISFLGWSSNQSKSYTSAEDRTTVLWWHPWQNAQRGGGSDRSCGECVLCTYRGRKWWSTYILGTIVWWMSDLRWYKCTFDRNIVHFIMMLVMVVTNSSYHFVQGELNIIFCLFFQYFSAHLSKAQVGLYHGSASIHQLFSLNEFFSRTSARIYSKLGINVAYVVPANCCYFLSGSKI